MVDQRSADGQSRKTRRRRFGLFGYIQRGFAAAWLQSRHLASVAICGRMGNLLAGLPALTMGVTLVVIIFGSRWLVPPSTLAYRYRSAADSATKNGEYATAEIYLLRVARMDGEQSDTVFSLALCYDSQWRSAKEPQAKSDYLLRREILLSRLAPPAATGHAPAHLWRAKQLLATSGASRRDADRAKAHLQRALRNMPEDAEVNGLLGRILLREGNTLGAEPLLVKGAAARPELNLALARIHASAGKELRAKDEARLAGDFFRQKLAGDPSNEAARVGWARAEFFLEHFEEAAKILEAGLAVNPSHSLRQALAEIHVRWSDLFVGKGKEDPKARMSHLEKAVALDPDNVVVAEKLVALRQSSGPESTKAGELVDQMMRDDKIVAAMAFQKGVEASKRGDMALARACFEKADKAEPRAPLIANNLAWTLAFSEPADPHRALAVIDRALEVMPNQVNCRETRGRILAKLGRWKESVADLEQVKPAFRNQSEWHRALAEGYEHLALAALATEHRRIADRLDAEKAAAIP